MLLHGSRQSISNHWASGPIVTDVIPRLTASIAISGRSLSIARPFQRQARAFSLRPSRADICALCSSGRGNVSANTSPCGDVSGAPGPGQYQWGRDRGLLDFPLENLVRQLGSGFLGHAKKDWAFEGEK